MRRGLVKKIIIIVLVIAVIVAGIFVAKKVIDNLPQKPVDTPIEQLPNMNIGERPERKISYLFRDNILGKNQEDLLEVLDMTADEIIYENIMGENVETTFKWNKSKLEAMYSTVEITDGMDYDYARKHQELLDEIIDSCDKSPVLSAVNWGDGLDRKFSSITWNAALKDGSLIIYDRFDLEDGSILLITCNNKYDEAITRSRSETIFQTCIVASKEYIDNFIEQLPEPKSSMPEEAGTTTETEEPVEEETPSTPVSGVGTGSTTGGGN